MDGFDPDAFQVNAFQTSESPERVLAPASVIVTVTAKGAVIVSVPSGATVIRSAPSVATRIS